LRPNFIAYASHTMIYFYCHLTLHEKPTWQNEWKHFETRVNLDWCCSVAVITTQRTRNNRSCLREQYNHRANNTKLSSTCTPQTSPITKCGGHSPFGWLCIWSRSDWHAPYWPLHGPAVPDPLLSWYAIPLSLGEPSAMCPQAMFQRIADPTKLTVAW
jgi:hypothetical protein